MITGTDFATVTDPSAREVIIAPSFRRASVILRGLASPLRITEARLNDGAIITSLADGSVTVAKSVPVITWATPAAVTYGTALSATQLNATASVSGNFSYSPALATVLGAGEHTLTATFTPADAVNYAGTTAVVPA